MALLSKIFGDANARYIKILHNRVDGINVLEDQVKSLSDDGLRAKTDEFKKRITDAYGTLQREIDALNDQIRSTIGDNEKLELKKRLRQLMNGPLDDILPEAFAVVREAAHRTLNQRHFDVQMMGGIVLHEGQVAEMKTGEGKTLTSTLSIYLNALTGKGVHVVTVNDYLAKRDAVWMGQVFNLLGLSIGIIVHESSFVYDPTATTSEEDKQRDIGVTVGMDFLRETDRKSAYRTDITYGTNNEFGFDYLRDNMAQSIDQRVQRDLNYAIIDEVDSILIDEARTPLIISAPDAQSTDKYYQFAQIVNTLASDTDYVLDEKLRAATLTEEGITKIEKILNVDNIYVEQGIQTVHHIEQALKAKTLFTRDKDYTVKDGQVIIVDEFTGRMLPGRRYSEGLHQAIEAKEGVKIERESKTMATITFQNYFRLYAKIAGMTGTAETEAEELAKIYGLDVTTIPTNKPMIRKDLQDRIYKSEEGKFKAVVDEIKRLHTLGQPVLVGTISIEKNEYLGALLEQEGLTFNMLNAKQHEREAEVIAQAGARGAITIATNMAGRGVDIKLGGLPFDESKHAEVVKCGGLHIIGTERHESRRIDNQLRGRSGRQGEPGSSQFYVSLEDDLMRIFGAERVKGIMKSWPEDMPIENAFISKSIESAQKRVEGNNFDIRKHLVEYDDVINKQRMYIYGKRNALLAAQQNDHDSVLEMAKEDIIAETEDIITFHTHLENTSEWDRAKLIESLRALTGMSDHQLSKKIDEILTSGSAHEQRQQIIDYISSHVTNKFSILIDGFNQQLTSSDHPFPAIEIITSIYLRSIDILWVEHLETMQYLRTGIGLRGYGQRDPLVEYKRESKDLFSRLLGDIRKQFVYSLLNIATNAPRSLETRTDTHTQLVEQKSSLEAFSSDESKETVQSVTSKPKDEEGHKIGRNDPCYCGSGLKYKKCHGAQ